MLWIAPSEQEICQKLIEARELEATIAQNVAEILEA